MQFEGEHLFPGQLGHFFILLAFTAALVSTIAFFIAGRTKDPILKYSWLRYARIAFLTQVVSVLTIFFTIFFICSHHYYEYFYAYKHASKDLEPKYLLACIWEGQEGSFLLWTIWHCVLGTILIFKSKQWEAHVMTLISFAQVLLTLMIFGVFVFGVKIGNSPFTLTRDEFQGPIFSMPNYLSFLKDGQGLNVLLRNYWMVIHPPILFLGFASTIVPAAYAYAGMATKKYGEWVKPALPWALFSGLVLGVGIMMGGKWAYESLSFGGYWAWDPVENASLVPWLVMIAGLHCMAIYNSTGHSLRASYLFIILSFAFVLYSTFLTRTGILGDTSVHAFTEAGLAMNVLIALLGILLVVPLLTLFFVNYKRIPAELKEENFSSREFWMFIGSLVFFLTAMFIISLTSVPVYNKIFHASIADPQDREFTYNKIIALVAIIVGLLSAITQYFRYKQTPNKYFLQKIGIPLVIAIIATILLAIFYPIHFYKKGPGFLGAIYVALFASIFSFVANAAYIKTVLKGNFKAAGASVAHCGFAILIVGMLISSANKVVISDNTKTGLMMPFDKDPTGKSQEDPMENLTLLRNVPTQMGNYMVTYTGDSAGKEKNRAFYALQVEAKGNEGKVKERFVLEPDVYRMKDNNLSSNPDIKHYLTHDVFTYISSLSDKSKQTDTSKFVMHEMKIGDTAFYNKGYAILNNVEKNPSNERFHFQPQDTALVAEVTIHSNDSTSYKAYPYLAVKDMDINFYDDTIFAKNLYVKLAGIGEQGKFKLALRESEVPSDFLTLKAYIFPYINLVWAGLIIMVAGFILTIIRRIKANTILGGIVLLAVASGLIYMFLLAN